MEEDKILVDAIGSILDRNENPLQISELVSMLNDGYLEYIGKDHVGSVTDERIEQCVRENEKLFDNYFGVISLKNQKYNSIKEIETELVEFINKSSDRTIIDFILCYLMFIRYDAVQVHFDLKKLPTGQLNFRTYGEPERMDCSIITNLIHQFSALYGGQSNSEEFKFNNEELINHRLEELIKIVRRIDWRPHKLSTKLFDGLIAKLKKLNRFNYKGKIAVPDELSQFVRLLVDHQTVNKVTELHSNFADFISFPSQKINASTEIEIVTDELIKAVQAGLRVAVKGYSNVSISCNIISDQQKEDSNIVISFPPFGNLQKSFWAEKFESNEIEISSLEELYTRISIHRLKNDGKAYLILPDNFLSGNRKSLLKLREDLTNNGWIDTIVKLPRPWMYPQAVISLNLVILNLRGVDSTYFFDLMEFSSQNQSEKNEVLKSASELIRGRVPVQNVARNVNFSTIHELGNDLSVNKHLSPIHFPDEHKRSESERLLNIGDLVNVIRPKRENVTQEHPFVNMTQLSDEASNYLLDIKSLPRKKKYSNDQPLLKEDSLLVGTVGGVLKPTLFQYNTKPIFLGSNVYPLRVDTSEIDPEYLIFELNTEFVKKQVRNYTKGSTIPHINRSDLLNIVVRVPERQEQARLFNEWITGIARNKIESLNIEKEKLFSEEFDLIHDMHHTLKNELSILKGAFRDIKSYLLQKSENENIVSLTEPIREIKKGADPSLYDSVEQKLSATERSLLHISSFVRDYKTILKFDPKKQNPEWIYIKDFLKELCSEYAGFEYNIIEEISTETEPGKVEAFQLKIDKALLRLIITNIIENAKNHGFDGSEDKKLIEFSIRDQSDDPKYYDIKDSSGNVIDQVDVSENWIEVVVRNTGKILKDDIDPQKLFKRGFGKERDKNRGIGLTHVKKAMKSLKGQVEIARPDDPIFSFEIRLKFPLGIGMSPNWEIIKTISIDD